MLVRAFPRRTTKIKIQRNHPKNPPKDSPKNPSLPTSLIQEISSENIESSNGEVYIVGGGPSLKNFNFSLLSDKCTIAVNKSIFHVPNPDYFISVDYTFLRKVSKGVFHSISAKKFFVADFSHSFLKEVDKQIIDTRFNMVYDLHDYNLLIRAHKYKGIGYAFKDFRTGRNSGFCALQLAIIFGFKKIYLLGIDLGKQKDTHYHEGYGESPVSFNPKLEKYYNYFKTGLEQLKQERPSIQVISCSPSSRLNNIIQYKDVEEVL